MHTYAQTHLQLYQQLTKAGYAKSDIVSINTAYEFAIQKFSGFYRPSGKPFLNHLVGVASIMVELNQPVNTVIAGLLHSIYLHGDFGSPSSSMSNNRRKQVQKEVNVHVEEVLYRYFNLRPDLKTLTSYRDNFHHLEELDQEVLLIRLSDILEDCLDDGVLYCPNWQVRKRHLQDIVQIIVELAQLLNHPLLAKSLEKIIHSTIKAEVTNPMRNGLPSNLSFLVVPSYYRKKWTIAFIETIIHTNKALTSFYRKVKRKLSTIVRSSFPFLKPS